MRRGKKGEDQLTMPRRVHSYRIEAVRVDFMTLKKDAKESAQALNFTEIGQYVVSRVFFFSQS